MSTLEENLPGPLGDLWKQVRNDGVQKQKPQIMNGQLWKLPRHERQEKLQRLARLTASMKRDTDDLNRAVNKIKNLEFSLTKERKEYETLLAQLL